MIPLSQLFSLTTWRQVLKLSANCSAKTLGLLSAVGYCVSLSGCTSTTVANSTSTSASDAKPSEPTVIRIAHQKGGLLTLARLHKTLEQKLAAQKVKVEWVGPFDRCAPLLQALASRSADIGLCGDIAVLSGLAAQMPLCMAAVRLPVPKAEAILVRSDSSIHTPSDLVGKKVAANTGGWGEHLTRRVLETGNIPVEKVKLVNLGPTDALPALLQGSVDAWTIWDPYVTIAEIEHGARRIASGDAAPHYLLYPANREVFTQKPAAFQAVLAALKQEGDWATQNPAPAAQLLSKQMKLSPEVTKRMVEVSPETLVPIDSHIIADIQKSADWMLERKVIRNKIDFASSVCPTALAKS